MTIFWVVGVPAIILAAVYFAIKGLIAFDRRVTAKFGHRFFSVWPVLGCLFGMVSLKLGIWTRVLTSDMPSHGTYEAYGIVLMFIGALLFGIVLLTNYRKSDFVHAVAGTAIEIALYPVVGLFLIMVLFGGIAAIGAMGGAGQSFVDEQVYVVDGR